MVTRVTAHESFPELPGSVSEGWLSVAAMACIAASTEEKLKDLEAIWKSGSSSNPQEREREHAQQARSSHEKPGI